MLILGGIRKVPSSLSILRRTMLRISMPPSPSSKEPSIAPQLKTQNVSAGLILSQKDICFCTGMYEVQVT